MKILVTGACGFIGSNLCESLLKDGHKVFGLDNLFSGWRENLPEGVEFIEHDVENPFPLFDVDQIYHLACPASPVHYQRFPVITVKTNVLGTFHALELAYSSQARILQASTSEVYGDPTEHPQKESYWGNVNPIGIRSCYDEGKRCAETLIMDYHRGLQVDVRLARIFNTYGPRMAINDGRVVSNLIVQALANEPMTVYGDGRQTRSFCYVSDMVEGLKALMNTEKVIGPINLGNPKECTILELAQLIREITGSKSLCAYKILPKDDPVRRCPDITLAWVALGWKPEVSIEKGLGKTIAYFNDLLGRESQ